MELSQLKTTEQYGLDFSDVGLSCTIVFIDGINSTIAFIAAIWLLHMTVPKSEIAFSSEAINKKTGSSYSLTIIL